MSFKPVFSGSGTVLLTGKGEGTAGLEGVITGCAVFCAVASSAESGFLLPVLIEITISGSPCPGRTCVVVGSAVAGVGAGSGSVSSAGVWVSSGSTFSDSVFSEGNSVGETCGASWTS